MYMYLSIHVHVYVLVTDRVVWCVGLCVSLSVTLVSPAKTAVLIKMPFGLRTQVGPGNHVLDEGQDSPMRRGIFEGGKGRPIVKYSHTLRSSLQKRLNQPRCRLGCGLRWDQGIMC